jgi:GT2 family glycosyltransferase
MIGVVVPVLNGADVVDGQLAALERQEFPGTSRVYVVDNGSTDGTIDVVSRFVDRLPLTIVRAATRRGINGARNAGAGAATRDGAGVLLFCDADDVVDDGWIAAMAEASRSWDAWGGALDRVRLSDPARLRSTHRRSTGLNPWTGYLPFASGANLGVRADVWQRVGRFDETFRGGGDDVDFSWRVQQAGCTLGFAPEAVVHYRERRTSRDLAGQFRAYGRQDPHLFRKHRERGMPASTIRQGLRAWAHLVLEAPRYAGAPARRGEWVRLVARRWGRIEGSIRFRTLYV